MAERLRVRTCVRTVKAGKKRGVFGGFEIGFYRRILSLRRCSTMTLTKLPTAHACEIKVYLALCYDYRACECSILLPGRFSR